MFGVYCLIKSPKKGINILMQNFKKTKIVATIGPTSSDEQLFTKMVKAGVDVVRLNFSHGDHKSHKKSVDMARRVSKKLDQPIAILQDLAGPKIRTGDFVGGEIVLKKGKKVTLTVKKIVGDENNIYVDYKCLPKEVVRGTKILLDDGRRELKVLNISGDDVLCRVIRGGVIKGRRGVSLPGVDLKTSSLTNKDLKDLEFGIKHSIDYFALSFVRTASDVKKLRAILNKRKSDAHIIAKIETVQAVKNINEIIEEADGIMVARGDLAVELAHEDVPLIQKDIIEKCNTVGKPVIVATQILESMIENPVPTRAEVSDVANSILDGTDAIMLSQETAFGKYPLEAVEVMTAVAKKVENNYLYRGKSLDNGFGSEELRENVTADAITASAVRIARRVDAKIIVALTMSGFTPRMVSRYRPTQPVLALTANEKHLNKMVLYFGCYPKKIHKFNYVVDTTDDIREVILKNKLAKRGDKIVIIAGVPLARFSGTNLCLVEVL